MAAGTVGGQDVHLPHKYEAFNSDLSAQVKKYLGMAAVVSNTSTVGSRDRRITGVLIASLTWGSMIDPCLKRI